jgi:uncharacterized membrane protein YbhN (UPF0104 family)
LDSKDQPMMPESRTVIALRGVKLSLKQNPKIVLIAKLSISLLFIWWLIKNKSYNLQNIELGLSNVKLALCFLVLTFFQMWLFSMRMQLLLKSKDSPIVPLKDLMVISWAANFINCVAPSSLFGDLFRIKKLTNLNATHAMDVPVYASFFSKIFSILGLVSITSLASIVVFQHSPELQGFLYLIYASLGFVLLLFLFRERVLMFLKPFYLKSYKISSSSFFHRRLDHLKGYGVTLSRSRGLILQIYLLSLGVQLLNTLSFVLIIYAINPQVGFAFGELLSVVPVGILIMTLPISFSGLGIGHVAFAQLLKPLGILNGSDIFSIFFAFSYLFNFLGVLPFYRLLKKKSL